MEKDYYKILGVDKSASTEEIKKAFHKLAHKHHPDKEGGDEKKFKEINEAYQVLSNTEKRQRYDQFGSNFESAGAGGFNWQDFANRSGGANPFGGGINFDLNDLGDIFGDMFGQSSQRSHKRREKGADLELKMSIDFSEAIFGAVKKINFSRISVCSHCQGNGAEPGTSINNCSVCNGTGSVSHVSRTFFGNLQTKSVCHNCQGNGQVFTKLCSKCSGEGAVSQKEEMEINVPAGIDDGQTIKFTGKGNAGNNGGRAGDLYITFKVLPSNKFKREGVDIFSTVEISFSLATFGGKVSNETVKGFVNLKIPAGTSAGKIFRLKGHGVPKIHGFGTGDHFVTINPSVPKKLTKEQKKLLQELEKQGL